MKTPNAGARMDLPEMPFIDILAVGIIKPFGVSDTTDRVA